MFDDVFPLLPVIILAFVLVALTLFADTDPPPTTP